MVLWSSSSTSVAQHVEPVDLGGQGRGDRGLGGVGVLRDLARGAGGVAGDDRRQAELADHLAALAERVHVAVHGPDRVEGGAGDGQQRELDAQEVLGDDVEVGVGQEVVDVGDPAGDRVVDRDHRQVGLAALHGREDVLERRAGERLVVGVVLAADQVGVRARLALVGDAWLCPVAVTGVIVGFGDVESLAVVSLVVALLCAGLTVVALRRTKAARGTGVEELPEDVHGLRQEVAALKREARRRAAPPRRGAVRRLRRHGRPPVLVAGAARRRRPRRRGHLDPRPQRGPYLRQEHLRLVCEQQLSPEEEEAITHARP